VSTIVGNYPRNICSQRRVHPSLGGLVKGWTWGGRSCLQPAEVDTYTCRGTHIIELGSGSRTGEDPSK
jgi:hypothetical protein